MEITGSTPKNRFRSGGIRREVLGGVVVATAALSAATADAAIVYSGQVNLQSEFHTTGKGGPGAYSTIVVALPGGNAFQVDLSGPGLLKTAPEFSAGLSQTAGLVQFAGFGGHLTRLVDEMIDANTVWSAGPQDFYFRSLGKSPGGPGGPAHPNGNWNHGDTGIFAFDFDNGGTTLYGWGRFTLGTGYANTYLVDYAYEDTGAGIRAADTGVIPEPGSAWLALMAGGALLFQRRRR